jgi:hypothetical protein
LGFVCQASQGERKILINRERVEQGGILKEKSHLTAHPGQVLAAEVRNVVLLNPYFAYVGLQERNDELQRHAFASSASPKNAQCLTGSDFE